MRKALVTGGEGFVGRYLVAALDERGYEITNIDLRSGHDCRFFFKNNTVKYDIVVHLAAIVGGRETIENEPLLVATDLAIDSDFFNWAVRTGQKHLVYYSSSAAYPIWMQQIGSTRKLIESNIDLRNVSNPDMTYGWAKLTGEYLAEFARRQGIRVDVYRPFSGYGTDQSLDYPFPSFIKRAQDRMDPFPVWGTGHQVRDWIHITDVVDASLAWSLAWDDSVTVNLCSGRPVSFMELAELVTTAASYTYAPSIEPMPDKPMGVLYRVGDPTRMHEVYTPKVSLEEGIHRALRDIR